MLALNILVDALRDLHISHSLEFIQTFFDSHNFAHRKCFAHLRTFSRVYLPTNMCKSLSVHNFAYALYISLIAYYTNVHSIVQLVCVYRDTPQVIPQEFPLLKHSWLAGIADIALLASYPGVQKEERECMVHTAYV